MSSPRGLVRADLRDFTGYSSARTSRLEGEVWLNANEAPWANPADADADVRRYPDPQPAALRARLAALYGCDPAQLLAGRGSDEAIDLLIRALCRPGADAVLVTPPTFGMYAVCARLHGARVVEVPLVDEGDAWRCDVEAVGDAALKEGVKIVFLCSPGNPTGSLLPLADIVALAQRLEGRGLVVVDEAYIEYADAPSSITLLGSMRNIAVLRTLSKAHALAAARIGSVIADAELVSVLQRCQAPYPLPGPCVSLALRALVPEARAATDVGIAAVVRERNELELALMQVPGVRAVYRSRANFVLVRFEDMQDAFSRLLAAGIVVRDMRAAPRLGDALRISLGTPQQNAAVLECLAARVVA